MYEFPSIRKRFTCCCQLLHASGSCFRAPTIAHYSLNDSSFRDGPTPLKHFCSNGIELAMLQTFLCSLTLGTWYVFPVGGELLFCLPWQIVFLAHAVKVKISCNASSFHKGEWLNHSHLSFKENCFTLKVNNFEWPVENLNFAYLRKIYE